MESETVKATEESQLERVLKIAKEFKPAGPEGSGCVYVFLGEATLEGFETETIDGKEFQSKPIWSVDETKTKGVIYAGKAGDKRRVYQTASHLLPSNPDNILVIRAKLCDEDTITLERHIITELGRILDKNRSDGCLVNIQSHHHGTRCYVSEANAYKCKINFIKAGAATAERHSGDVICMDANKNIISRGGVRQLARELGVNAGNIVNCCKRRINGMVDRKSGVVRYFCYATDYTDFVIKQVSAATLNKSRLILAQQLKGDQVIIGTASEIAQHIGANISKSIHKVARGVHKSVYGWSATYIDTLETSLIPTKPTELAG